MDSVQTRDRATHEDILDRMFYARDMLEGEIFRRVYGVEAGEQLEKFHQTKCLPHQVRVFCLDLLNR